MILSLLNYLWFALITVFNPRNHLKRITGIPETKPSEEAVACEDSGNHTAEVTNEEVIEETMALQPAAGSGVNVQKEHMSTSERSESEVSKDLGNTRILEKMSSLSSNEATKILEESSSTVQSASSTRVVQSSVTSSVSSSKKVTSAVLQSSQSFSSSEVTEEEVQYELA